MPAKDAFFQKVQENKVTQQSQEESIKRDIQTYTTSMVKLTQQIQQWVNGSGVSVTVSEVDFQDDTLSMMQGSIRNLSRYRNVTLKITNDNKTASLTPLGVYGGGAVGWASLVIDNPSRAPRQERFLLRLNREDNVWSIRPDITPNLRDPLLPENTPLTEEIFFQTISSLA
jgi:hypothetical protein